MVGADSVEGAFEEEGGDGGSGTFLLGLGAVLIGAMVGLLVYILRPRKVKGCRLDKPETCSPLEFAGLCDSSITLGGNAECKAACEQLNRTVVDDEVFAAYGYCLFDNYPARSVCETAGITSAACDPQSYYYCSNTGKAAACSAACTELRPDYEAYCGTGACLHAEGPDSHYCSYCNKNATSHQEPPCWSSCYATKYYVENTPGMTDALFCGQLKECDGTTPVPANSARSHYCANLGKPNPCATSVPVFEICPPV